MEIEKIFKNDVDSIADNIFGVVNNSVSEAREMQKRKVAENVQLVVQALKKMESDIRDRYDSLTNNIENRVMTIKDGRDGINGKDGKDGKDGRPGRDGKDGRPGADGKDGAAGRDGNDGVSITNAKLDFDNSLVIYLSNGQEINVGEIMPFDVAEKIKVITNGGGTSQSVLDTLTSLQTQINALSSLGAVSYQGTWNASTNSPTITSGSGTKGYYYVVSTAGSTTIDGQSLWGVGDWIVYNGSVWQKVDGGSTGNLTTLDVSTSATFSYGTANGLLYLNGSKVATSGSALTFDGSSMVLDTSTSSTALRITQRGSGDALLVEDSTNPDSTPFVINAGGTAIFGTTASATLGLNGQLIEAHTANAINGQGALFAGWSATQPNAINIARSQSGTVGTNGIVSSGSASSIRFFFDDGTNFIRGASIDAVVDGTPGTNDMPGRLVFATTADGASSPTERMRIDSVGGVGIGTTAISARRLAIGGSMTGAISAYGILVGPTSQPDVTANAYFFGSLSATASNGGTPYTLNSAIGFNAAQGTFHADSTVTNQYGFVATSSLTGATNNYGFYSNIASATNRWNFYANGTANNYFAGNLGVGVTTPSTKLEVSGTTNQSAQVTASISGTTMDVTAVTSGTLAVGDLVFGANVQPYTRITALGTGTGGIGTYTVSVSQTSASATVNSTPSYGNTLIRITDTDTTQLAGQPNGGLQFYTSDSSTPTAGVGAYVATIAESATPDTALVFGTRDNAGGGVDANERMRIDSSGNVLITSSGGLGYGTGSGGTVTQATSRTTGVTLNKTNGAITLVSAAGSITWQSFIVTNSTVAATDTVIVNQKSGTDLYQIFVTAVSAGSFTISFATTGGVTTEQPVFNFAVIKAVAA